MYYFNLNRNQKVGGIEEGKIRALSWLVQTPRRSCRKVAKQSMLGIQEGFLEEEN